MPLMPLMHTIFSAKGERAASPVFARQFQDAFQRMLAAGGALTESNRFFKQTQRIIIPLTVREIALPAPAAVLLRPALEEQIAHKLA